MTFKNGISCITTYYPTKHLGDRNDSVLDLVFVEEKKFHPNLLVFL